MGGLDATQRGAFLPARGVQRRRGRGRADGSDSRWEWSGGGRGEDPGEGSDVQRRALGCTGVGKPDV